jgi:hypothetical protein
MSAIEGKADASRNGLAGAFMSNGLACLQVAALGSWRFMRIALALTVVHGQVCSKNERDSMNCALFVHDLP